MDNDTSHATPPRSILLHVVSPSPEAQRLTFPDTPLTTTIGEVKLMIQGAVASRPTPERQRLIYQGKPLVNAEATLENVLGREGAAAETVESFTLHLVLPPTVSAPRNGTSANPNPQAMAPGLSSLLSPGSLPNSRPHSQNSTRATAGSPAPQAFPGGSYPSVGFGQPPGQEPPRPWAYGNAHPSAALPPPGFSGMPHHHHHHHHHPPQFQNPYGPFSGHGLPNATNLPAHLQQAVNSAQQQYVRQQNGEGQNGPQNNTNQENRQEAGQEQQPQNRSQTQTPSHSTVIREGQMPGGQWRMVMNSTTVPISHNFHQNHVPGQPPGGAQNVPQSYNIQQEIQNIRRGLSEAQNMMLQLPGMPGGRTLPFPMAPVAPSHSTFPPMVYLLSSPDGGYQALLTSPRGTYSTPGFGAPMPSNPFGGLRRPNMPQPFPFQPPTGPSAQPPNAPNAAQPPQNHPHDQVANHAQPQPQAQPPNNEAADLIRIIMNIGGHIWFIVRLLGFIWLVTHGSSWFRTFAFGICAAVVFLAQTGALARPMHAAFDPVRRHLEDLLNEDPVLDPQGPVGRGTQAQRESAVGSPDAPMPTPEELSQRLLRQRRERDMGWARRHFRRWERSLVLFAASLVPGVGELHVAAREAAQARLREEAERQIEERRRREEEQREGAGEGAVGNAEGGNNEGATEPAQEPRDAQSTQMGATAPAPAPVEQNGGPSAGQEGLRQREGFEVDAAGGVD